MSILFFRNIWKLKFSLRCIKFCSANWKKKWLTVRHDIMIIQRLQKNGFFLKDNLIFINTFSTLTFFLGWFTCINLCLCFYDTVVFTKSSSDHFGFILLFSRYRQLEKTKYFAWLLFKIHVYSCIYLIKIEHFIFE